MKTYYAVSINGHKPRYVGASNPKAAVYFAVRTFSGLPMYDAVQCPGSRRAFDIINEDRERIASAFVQRPRDQHAAKQVANTEYLPYYKDYLR